MNYQYSDEVYEIDDSDVVGTSRTLRNRNLLSKDSMAKRRVRQLVIDSKLSDFDPEKSVREKRKINRKSYAESTNQRSMNLYDEKGRIRSTGADLCDCLDSTCPGCHFPCSNCRSTKCGSFCRVNRKWAFDSIEHDGKDLIIQNKAFDK